MPKGITEEILRKFIRSIDLGCIITFKAAAFFEFYGPFQRF